MHVPSVVYEESKKNEKRGYRKIEEKDRKKRE
jgi:hypothetical protein